MRIPSEVIHEFMIPLRDKFANSAMQSILLQKHYDGQQLYDLSPNNGLSSYSMLGDEIPEYAIQQAKQHQLDQADFVAKLSYIMADAMLKQREL